MRKGIARSKIKTILFIIASFKFKLYCKNLSLKITNYSTIIIILLFLSSSSFSQTNEKKEVSNYFDKIVGQEILNINNGKIYIDLYNLKTTHNYYSHKNFVKGTVFYDNQLYENIPIKYDIYTDQLVKSFENNDTFGITLINEKTDYFLIEDKRFVNIDSKYKFPKIITGFFEEKYLGKNISLYIKHFKTAKEIIIESSLYTEFKEYSDYQLLYNSTFTAVNTQKEILTAFPQLKKEIKNYYKKNKILEETNPYQFKADLIQFIDNNL
ncbi:hypothetical protein EYY60_18100 [Flavobacterium zhairuonense]|uniref:hypothetical protein n=1 Tax=Flavobacterium zhairuonense TaxID=2493631 RepID=UPI00104BF98D|nr:hypothetical protein [Flavobacterium zhairuonense]KAF2507861.1 hypothetical protein EYY60_18100 [Flavobacterium zhairuonense]